MATDKSGVTDKGGVKEYAEGWISERKGTDVPTFLRVVYIALGAFCVAYFILDRNGEVGHATRGALVKQFNLSTGTADAFMYMVAAILALTIVAIVTFAFRKLDDH